MARGNQRTTKQGSSSFCSSLPSPLLPLGWPSNVVHLTAPVWSHLLTTLQLQALRSRKGGSFKDIAFETCLNPCPLVRITPITDSNHPACGQYGLCAAEHLPPNHFILSYLGYVHGAQDTDESSDYDIALDRDLDMAVDASLMGNEARFINDYRGIRTEGANAEFRDCWIDLGNGMVEKRVGVYVLSAGKSGKRAKGIAKGAEILVSYGKGFWNNRRNTADGPDSCE